MNDFIDDTYKRVEKIITLNNLNIKSFEELIEVSNNSVGTAIRRQSSFKSNVLNKILFCFPEVNPTWLLTGRGEMIISKDASEAKRKVSSAAKEDITLQTVQEQINLILTRLKDVDEFMSLVATKIDIEGAIDTIKSNSK